MDLAIDASVVLAVAMNEPTKPALVAQTTGATLLAPASVHWEIGNALTAMFKRRQITLSAAQQVLAVYRGIPIRFLDVDMEAALELADRLAIYAYDAYLIATALAQSCPLLTLDDGVRHAAVQAGVKVIQVSP